MNRTDTTMRKPLRLVPGVALAALLILIRFVPPLVHPEGGLVAILGSVDVAAMILLWWLFFSRAPWSERIGALDFKFGADGYLGRNASVTRWRDNPQDFNPSSGSGSCRWKRSCRRSRSQGCRRQSR